MSLAEETWATIHRSLLFAGFSILLSSIPGVLLGIWAGWRQDRTRHLVFTLFQSLAALPTVVIGLVIYGLLSRSGPLGGLGLLYTPAGVVIGQYFLALPIVVSFVAAGFRNIDPRFRETLETLGIGLRGMLVHALREGRAVIASGIALAFSRVLGEVGVAMMLGGNLRGSTRTMTTAIALHAAKGEFGSAVVMGLVLLAIALAVNWGIMLHGSARGGSA
ncbi:MAG: ABC transporter permease [Spirochaetales bacterium]|nr:ABC transporter permease [Spirochaetales bacterium]